MTAVHFTVNTGAIHSWTITTADLADANQMIENVLGRVADPTSFIGVSDIDTTASDFIDKPVAGTKYRYVPVHLIRSIDFEIEA